MLNYFAVLHWLLAQPSHHPLVRLLGSHGLVFDQLRQTMTMQGGLLHATKRPEALASLMWAAVRGERPSKGPFDPEFRSVWLLGELVPIPLTRLQGEIFRILWEHEGKPLRGPALMQRAQSEGVKPVDAFRKNLYPDPHRSYQALVRTNRRGEYWLPRAGMTAAALSMTQGQVLADRPPDTGLSTVLRSSKGDAPE